MSIYKFLIILGATCILTNVALYLMYIKLAQHQPDSALKEMGFIFSLILTGIITYWFFSLRKKKLK